MAIQTILRMGNLLLLQQSKPIEYFNTPELDRLVDDLWATMRANNGVGLAAPQIGVLKQVVLFGMQHNLRYPNAMPVPEQVLINPIITPIGNETTDGWEGCLSIPSMRGNVTRYESIRYTAFNAQGESFAYEVDGFHARVVQHECDHLWGKLYPMRMNDMSQFGFVDVLDAMLKLGAK